MAEEPRIAGAWWEIAANPDLGDLSSAGQEPVDFAVWPATDGTWQLWSCIRKTRAAGHTRLLYRWEGRRLTERAWRPIGIAMQANPRYGETAGGLQAPHVVRVDDQYCMFYGDWEHVCVATSTDGKTFRRRLGPDGTPALFGEGAGANTRDPMLLRIGDRWHCYYTANPGDRGAVYCRTSPDLQVWSAARIVAAGGRAGDGPWSAECPFVVARPGGSYHLFRTQRYGVDAVTSVYRSADPLDFGIDDDAERFVGTLPVAAPEIVEQDGGYYIAALSPMLNGIRVARLDWVTV